VKPLLCNHQDVAEILPQRPAKTSPLGKTAGQPADLTDGVALRRWLPMTPLFADHADGTYPCGCLGTRRRSIGTTLMAVEATSWNDLQARYAMQRIDHQVATACQAASTQASGRVILPTAASRDRTPPSHRGHPSNQVSAGVGLARGSSSREQWAADPCHHGAGDGGSSVGGLMQVLATVGATNLESGNINQVQIRNI
jgi:hypothetical protein